MASDRSDFDARDLVRSDVELGEIESSVSTKNTRNAGGVRKILRRGKRVLVLDFRYRIPDGPNKGRSARYRRDAEVQTWPGARAEYQRRLAALATTGSPFEIVDSKVRAQVLPQAVEAAFTFGDAMDEWLAEYVPTRKAATQFTYQDIARTKLKGFRNVPLKEFGAEHVRSIQKRDREAGRSTASTNQSIICIRSVLAFALERKRIESKPVLPSLKRRNTREIVTYSDQEVQALIAACESPLERLLILLACYAGLRSAEMRGLRWRDVDLHRRTLTVRQAITRGPGKDGKASGLHVELPKNANERTIPLHGALFQELSAMGARDPLALVCSSRLGGPLGFTRIFVIWNQIRIRAGVRRIPSMVHAGRHYFGTTLCRARVNVRAVQKLLEHSDITMTMRYVHAVSKDLEDAIGDLEALTLGASKECDRARS